MNKKVMAGAAALALLLLGGCAAPSERPGQATPSPTPSVTTESVAPASPTPSAPTPAPALANNWPALIANYPQVVEDLLKAGWTLEQVTAQAAIRTTKGEVPNATVKVAFGSTSGGDLVSTGDCKVISPQGECPSEGLVEGLLPIRQQQGGEPYLDYSKGVLIGFTADNQPFVIKDLTLKKR